MLLLDAEQRAHNEPMEKPSAGLRKDGEMDVLVAEDDPSERMPILQPDATRRRREMQRRLRGGGVTHHS